MPTAATVAVTSDAKEVHTLTIANGAADTFAIPYANMYRNVVVQALTGNAGDTYTLQASVDAGTYVTVGETVTGTVPATSLTGQGIVWYTKGIPMHFNLVYVNAGPNPATVVIRLDKSIFQGSRTRSL